MASDPYKYFRIEGRELLELLSQGVLELDKGIFSKELIGRLLRHAHTLKGAARIVAQVRIAELSHAIEAALAPHKDEGTLLSRERINELLELLDGIAAQLSALGPTGPAHAEADRQDAAAPEEHFETVRIEIEEMDAFLGEVFQAGVHVTAIRRELAGFDNVIRLAADLGERFSKRSRSSPGTSQPGRGATPSEELQSRMAELRRNLEAAAERAERELSLVQDRAGEMRLLSASRIFSPLERAARDAAQALGKTVEFQTSGGEHRLDAHVLRAVRDALMHIVRNAVAHGIEAKAARIAAGKPAVGRVELRVERRGNRVVFSCEDDGGGIDLEQVRRAAVERGLVSQAESAGLALPTAIEVLLRGGITTSPRATQVSGRGVGLDVVRDTIGRLKGDVKAVTSPSRGTTVTLSVPVSLEALSVLEVEAAGLIVSVPLDAVVRSVRVFDQEIAHSSEADSILFEGKTVPFAPLARLLRPGSNPRPPSWTVLIVESDSELAAIGVDHLLRRTNVVMRQLPRLAGRVEMITGASFDSDGNPRMVLDPAALIPLVCAGSTGPEPGPEPKRPLLVIDDSLTTRMLEKSILETAGYEVDVAVSAEEGLTKAHQRRYAVFVVDIEMPGMDGFEFIRRVRADPQLQDTPSILVTSRASSEDRRRGEQAGALAYIVKSEFNEGELLGTIRGLIG